MCKAPFLKKESSAPQNRSRQTLAKERRPRGAAGRARRRGGSEPRALRAPAAAPGDRRPTAAHPADPPAEIQGGAPTPRYLGTASARRQHRPARLRPRLWPVTSGPRSARRAQARWASLRGKAGGGGLRGGRTTRRFSCRLRCHLFSKTRSYRPK